MTDIITQTLEAFQRAERTNRQREVILDRQRRWVKHLETPKFDPTQDTYVLPERGVAGSILPTFERMVVSTERLLVEDLAKFVANSVLATLEDWSTVVPLAEVQDLITESRGEWRHTDLREWYAKVLDQVLAQQWRLLEEAYAEAGVE